MIGIKLLLALSGPELCRDSAQAGCAERGRAWQMKKQLMRSRSVCGFGLGRFRNLGPVLDVPPH